jgi:hypothetical protein
MAYLRVDKDSVNKAMVSKMENRNGKIRLHFNEGWETFPHPIEFDTMQEIDIFLHAHAKTLWFQDGCIYIFYPSSGKFYDSQGDEDTRIRRLKDLNIYYDFSGEIDY